MNIQSFNTPTLLNSHQRTHFPASQPNRQMVSPSLRFGSSSRSAVNLVFVVGTLAAALFYTAETIIRNNTLRPVSIEQRLEATSMAQESQQAKILLPEEQRIPIQTLFQQVALIGANGDPYTYRDLLTVFQKNPTNPYAVLIGTFKGQERIHLEKLEALGLLVSREIVPHHREPRITDLGKLALESIPAPKK